MSKFAPSQRLTSIGALCAVTCLLTMGSPSISQQPSSAPTAQGAAPAPMTFDKVMFYPDTTADKGDGFLWWGIPNYWAFCNVSSLNLIANAYGLGMHQVIGIPGWAQTDRYSLLTNMDLEKLEVFKTLPMDEQLKQQRLMMQAVLVDKYQLKAHLETREMPVYELVVANGGLKLTEKVSEGRPGLRSLCLDTGPISARWRTSPANSLHPRAVSLSTRRDWGRRHSITSSSGLQTVRAAWQGAPLRFPRLSKNSSG